MDSINSLNLKIAQLSYVYRDIEKQAKLMEDLYDFPKFSFISYPEVTFYYRGEKVKAVLKTGRSRAFNNYGIELIQLLRGDKNLYKEFLDQGREGLHHYDILVNNFDEYLEFFKQKGIKSIQFGISLLRWAYLDTQSSFGIILELIEIARNKKKE